MSESNVCHCNHLRVWHGGTNARGACDITGPRPTDGCECKTFRPRASPMVTVHLTRRQAEVALSSLRWDAEGRAKSNPLWAVVRRVEAALAENTGVASDG